MRWEESGGCRRSSVWLGGSYLYDGVFRGCPGRHDLAVQPPAAIGVDHVPLHDQVLQHILGLVLAAQHEAPEAVVDGQDLRPAGENQRVRSPATPLTYWVLYWSGLNSQPKGPWFDPQCPQSSCSPSRDRCPPTPTCSLMTGI